MISVVLGQVYTLFIGMVNLEEDGVDVIGDEGALISYHPHSTFVAIAPAILANYGGRSIAPFWDWRVAEFTPFWKVCRMISEIQFQAYLTFG